MKFSVPTFDLVSCILKVFKMRVCIVFANVSCIELVFQISEYSEILPFTTLMLRLSMAGKASGFGESAERHMIWKIYVFGQDLEDRKTTQKSLRSSFFLGGFQDCNFSSPLYEMSGSTMYTSKGQGRLRI